MAQPESRNNKTALRRGDLVIVISGGNKSKRPIKGKTGRIVRFVGTDRSRAIVEGLNMVVRHQRAKGPGTTAGRIQKEAPIHVSRLMFYDEKLKRPVRLRSKVLEGTSASKKGRKVRGYINPETKEFTQVVES